MVLRFKISGDSNNKTIYIQHSGRIGKTMDKTIRIFLTFALCDLVLSSNVSWINSTIRSHFSKNRHHVTNPQHKRATMEFIRTYMSNTLHLDVYLDVFTTRATNVKGTNVIGVMKGKNFGTADDIFYGIGAHYDTMRNTSGVNDNGSGVTIMLDAATSLAKKKDRRFSCFFVAFDFEEWEYSSKVLNAACDESTGIGCGSANFIQQWIPSFIANFSEAPRFGGIYVMDTIMNFNDTDGVQTLPNGINIALPKQYESIQSDGFDGDFVAAIGRRDDHTLLDLFQRTWSSNVLSSAEVESLSLPISGIPTIQEQTAFVNFFRSDHIHFWQNNMPAIFLTDTANLRGYMTNCYHQPCDDVSHVTHDRLLFMSKTSDALYLALDSLTKDPSDKTGDATGLKGSCMVWIICAVVSTVLFKQYI